MDDKTKAYIPQDFRFGEFSHEQLPIRIAKVIKPVFLFSNEPFSRNLIRLELASQLKMRIFDFDEFMGSKLANLITEWFLVLLNYKQLEELRFLLFAKLEYLSYDEDKEAYEQLYDYLQKH